MPHDTLRIGIVGLGQGGRVHLPAFQALPEARVVAVCARTPGAAAAVALQHDIATAYADVRDLLADRSIDVVSVAAPPSAQHAIAIGALQAGKHVLLERPMAATVAQARDLVRQAVLGGLVHAVYAEHRYRARHQQLHAVLQRGVLGALRTVTVAVFRPSTQAREQRSSAWQYERDTGGGQLSVAAAPVVDALLWHFGPASGVTARLSTSVLRRQLPTGTTVAATAEDTAALILDFAGGGIGVVHVCGTALHGTGEHWEVYGSEGSAVLTDDDALLLGRRTEPDWDELPAANPTFTAPAASPVTRFQAFAAAFLAAVRGGPAVAPSFQDGLRVVEVLGGAQKAGRNGQWVPLVRESARGYSVDAAARLRFPGDAGR